MRADLVHPELLAVAEAVERSDARERLGEHGQRNFGAPSAEEILDFPGDALGRRHARVVSVTRCPHVPSYSAASIRPIAPFATLD